MTKQTIIYNYLEFLCSNNCNAKSQINDDKSLAYITSNGRRFFVRGAGKIITNWSISVYSENHLKSFFINSEINNIIKKNQHLFNKVK